MDSAKFVLGCPDLDRNFIHNNAERFVREWQEAGSPIDDSAIQAIGDKAFRLNAPGTQRRHPGSWFPDYYLEEFRRA